MAEQLTIMTRERPCPGCGYDLRAAVVNAGQVTCSECGVVVAVEKMVASRIPWVHREVRGRVKAYAETVWMVVRRPGALGREMGARVRRRDAEGFHRTSMVVGAMIGTGLLGVAFGVRQPRAQIQMEQLWSLPARALADSWWGLAVLFVGLWTGMRMVAAGYRWVVRMGVRGDFDRRRAGRIGLYASALAPVEMGLLGLAVLASMAMNWGYEWTEKWQSGLGMVGVGLVVIGAVVYWVRTVALVWKIGRWKMWRGIFLVVVYPAVAIFVMFCSVVAAMWLGGYAAIAIRATMR